MLFISEQRKINGLLFVYVVLKRLLGALNVYEVLHLSRIFGQQCKQTSECS